MLWTSLGWWTAWAKAGRGAQVFQAHTFSFASLVSMFVDFLHNENTGNIYLEGIFKFCLKKIFFILVSVDLDRYAFILTNLNNIC